MRSPLEIVLVLCPTSDAIIYYVFTIASNISVLSFSGVFVMISQRPMILTSYHRGPAAQRALFGFEGSRR